MAKLTVSDLELSGKKVLMRVDFNVPIKAGVIGNDNRIVAALPTIKYVLENNGRAILFSHLGRIKSEDDKKELSLAPVAARLGELLGKNVKFVPHTRGEELESEINALQDGEVLMVENTRFEDVVDGVESKTNQRITLNWVSIGLAWVMICSSTMPLVQHIVPMLQTLVLHQMFLKQLLVS